MLSALSTSSTGPPVLRRNKVVGTLKVDASLPLVAGDPAFNIKASPTQVNDLIDIKNAKNVVISKVAINGTWVDAHTGQQQLQGIWS